MKTRVFKHSPTHFNVGTRNEVVLQTTNNKIFAKI